jgi:tetratricopeptide (TPR) repeat protein
VLPLACGPAAPPPVTRPPIPQEEIPYLLPPSNGAPAETSPEALRALDAAFQARLLAGDASGAADAAEQALRRDPESAPAQVLLGQARLVASELPAARTVLATVVARYPGYTAAQLALGRAADRAGDAVAAFAAYREVAGASPAAAQRAQELQGPAVEQLGGTIDAALSHGRIEDARASLATLRAWAPADRKTLQATIAVARAGNEPRAELEAVRALLVQGGGDEALLDRRGELEIQVGQPSAAIRIYEELQRRHPEDARFPMQLERAKFRFRLVNLPSDVKRLVDDPELTRADFATLLYWLVPGVRAAVVSAPHIASDILEHPRKQEIMRVVNLELMDLDERLRLFYPDARLRRGQAFKALLTVLARSQPAPACVGTLQGGGTATREALCEGAAACGLLPESADCLPDAGASGAEAAEWIRLALARLPP